MKIMRYDFWDVYIIGYMILIRLGEQLEYGC